MSHSLAIARNRTLLMAILCFGGAFISGYLLYLDLVDIGEVSGTGKVLAHVEQAISSVKRRSASSFLWTNVEHGTALYRRDSVQVGPASQAVIRLKDDSLLEIGERSLVIIEDVPPLEMKFLKGNFIVRGRTQDHIITVEENQAPVITPVPIRLMTPAPNEVFFLLDKAQQRVSFRWSPSENAGADSRNIAPVLEISKSKRFTRRSTQVIPLDNNRTNTFSANFPVGEFYWRVRAENLLVFETRSFTVEKPVIPELIYPASNRKVTRFESIGPVEFSWIVPERAPTVPGWIELSQSPKFEKRAVLTREEISLNAGKIQIANVPVGTYYWRLLMEYPSRTLSTATESFVLERNTDVTLTLVQPTPGARVPHQKTLPFSWTFAADEMDYKIQIQKLNESRTESLVEQALNERSFGWTPTDAGRYRWRVTVSYKNEPIKTSSWQDFFVFDEIPIVMISPAVRTAFQYWKNLPDFALEWTPQEIAKQGNNRYRLTLANNPELTQNTKVFRTIDNKISRRTLKISNGHYYWQVQVVDGEDRALKTSPVQDFYIQNFPLLAPPQKADPPPSTVINLVLADQEPKATWAPIPDAQAYEVIVKKDGRAIASTKTEKPEYSFKDLKPGKYTWTARGIDPLNRPGNWLKEREISLSYGKRLKAPEIVGSKVE